MGNVFFAGGKIDMMIPRLPVDYLQVKFIQSHGTAYIDTGFKPNQNTKLVMKVTPTANGGYYFGSATYPSDDTYHDHDGQGEILFDNAFELGQSYPVQVTGGYIYPIWSHHGSECLYFTNLNQPLLGTVHNITMDNTGVTVSSSATVFSEGVFSQKTFQCVGSLYLLARNVNGVASGKIPARLYYCQLYDNGKLVRDFIPCVTGEGEVGMYELVEGKFYGNAGTGSFVASEV